MGGDGFEREEQRRPAKATVIGDERAGIYARRVGVQSLLPGKRERRHVQPSSLVFSVLDTFLFALFFSWTSTKTTMQSSAMMEKNIAWLL